MRKTIITASLLVILTLSLTQLATSQEMSTQGMSNWKDNVFTNETSGDVFVAFTTYRPRTSDVPLGWRTVAWYRINAGNSHTFLAYKENPIYYLIIDQATGRRLLPENAKSYTGWRYNKAFVIVSKDEPNALTPAADLLFTTHARTSNLLLKDSNYFKSANTGSVTVTPTGVIAPLAEIVPAPPPPTTEEGTTDLDETGTTALETGWQATITASVDGQALDTDETGRFQATTNAPIRITAQLRRDGRLTRGTLFFSFEGPAGAKVDKDTGTTDNEAKVTALLTLGKLPGQYKFIVKLKSDALEDDPATQIDETAPIKLAELIFIATEGPGADASSIEISGPSAVDPRGGSQTGSVSGNISLTFTVETPAGNPVVNASVSVTALSGPAIEDLPAARPKTNAQGKASFTLRLKGSSLGDLIIRADVGEVTATKTIEVRHTLGSVSFTNGLASSIYSGRSDTVEVIARSKIGTPLPGVTIRFTSSSSNLRFTTSSGRTSTSSGKFKTTVQTRNKTSGSWNSTGTTYTTNRTDKITATASYLGHSRSASDSTKVMPSSRERQTAAEHFGSRHAGTFGARDWYWTGWRTVSLSSSECRTVLHWWGYASVSVVDDPFVDEEDIRNEDPRAIKKVGTRSWQVRVRIREHKVEQNEVWVRVKARCEFIDDTFGAPSLPQLSQHPETHHLSETWQQLSQVPSQTALLPNYPNPFNPETWIPYHLSDPAEVALSIYSTDGRLVRTLALGHQDAGIYESKSRAAYWDGRNSVGERVASGLYFYTLTAGDFADTGKMLIMK